VGKHLEKR